MGEHECDRCLSNGRSRPHVRERLVDGYVIAARNTTAEVMFTHPNLKKLDTEESEETTDSKHATLIGAWYLGMPWKLTRVFSQVVRIRSPTIMAGKYHMGPPCQYSCLSAQEAGLRQPWRQKAALQEARLFSNLLIPQRNS